MIKNRFKSQYFLNLVKSQYFLNFMTGVLLDLAKPFDTVKSQYLYKKQYWVVTGIGGIAFKILKSCLIERKQLLPRFDVIN